MSASNIRKFSVMWTNTASFQRNMTRQILTLRPNGITCDRLHIDLVHLLFRPSATIAPEEFVPGDGPDSTWRVETASLLVRLRPGVEHTFYAVGGLDNHDHPIQESNGVGIKQPTQCAVYSAALAVAPNVEGNEDYWSRTYRPVRDTPAAEQLHGVTELDIELMFPMLMASNNVHTSTPFPYRTIPDYRVLQVLIEFSGTAPAALD